MLLFVANVVAKITAVSFMIVSDDIHVKLKIALSTDAGPMISCGLANLLGLSVMLRLIIIYSTGLHGGRLP